MNGACETSGIPAAANETLDIEVTFVVFPPATHSSSTFELPDQIDVQLHFKHRDDRTREVSHPGPSQTSSAKGGAASHYTWREMWLLFAWLVIDLESLLNKITPTHQISCLIHSHLHLHRHTITIVSTTTPPNNCTRVRSIIIPYSFIIRV